MKNWEKFVNKDIMKLDNILAFFNAIKMQLSSNNLFLLKIVIINADRFCKLVFLPFQKQMSEKLTFLSGGTYDLV